jgi:hypothetical protein
MEEKRHGKKKMKQGKAGKDKRALGLKSEFKWKKKGQNWKSRSKSQIFDFVKLGLKPKSKAQALKCYVHPSRPNCQAQFELGPEIFKAHFEYAPATSKCTVQHS